MEWKNTKHGTVRLGMPAVFVASLRNYKGNGEVVLGFAHTLLVKRSMMRVEAMWCDAILS